VAAALATSRAGLKTALIEKTVLWGGMATSGLVPIYMPLCDGRGRQVTFGIAEELLHASIKYGPGPVPPGWIKRSGPAVATDEYEELYADSGMEKRFYTYFAPMSFAMGLDEVLDKSKIDLWLDTLACLPIVKGRKVAGMEVENKSGRICINASQFIDATGDADIAYRAGAPCVERGSLPSMLYQYTSLALAGKAVDRKSGAKLVTWKGGGAANEMGKGYVGTMEKKTGTDGKGLSEWFMESRRVARLKLALEQKTLGRQNIYPAALPTMHQIRMTRRIDGEDIVKDGMMNHTHPDSIGMIADYRKTNAVWEVPYGSILPQKVDNLLVVGRCSAAEEYVWQVTRLIQSAALTGQVAGIAATLALRRKTTPRALEIKLVQQQAIKQSIVLHL
jgi:hypothetical protein